MADRSPYTHPQLDPYFNRTRKTPTSTPRKPDSNPPDFPRVNPEDPYTNTYLGKISVSFRDEKGLERPALLYIPKQRNRLEYGFGADSRRQGAGRILPGRKL